MRSFDRIIGLYEFPFKSGSPMTVNGKAPQELSIGPAGARVGGVTDREYSLVRWAGGQWWPLTQQLVPGLATVEVDLRPEECLLRFTVPQKHTKPKSYEMGVGHVDGPQYEVNTRENNLRVIGQGRAASRFFIDALGLQTFGEVQFVRADPSQTRYVLDQHKRPENSNKLAGAEYAAISMVNKADINWLEAANELPPDTLPFNRARPTIVSSGEYVQAATRDWRQHPYQLGEDFMRVVAFGENVVADVTRPIRRGCEHPNTNQQTGERDHLGTAVFAGREGHDRDGRIGRFLGLGLNPRIAEHPQTIRIGQPVEILEWRQPDDPLVVLDPSGRAALQICSGSEASPAAMSAS